MTTPVGGWHCADAALGLSSRSKPEGRERRVSASAIGPLALGFAGHARDAKKSMNFPLAIDAAQLLIAAQGATVASARVFDR
jgi:hypothetical protein